jgi:hypothetical protein
MTRREEENGTGRPREAVGLLEDVVEVLLTPLRVLKQQQVSSE